MFWLCSALATRRPSPLGRVSLYMFFPLWNGGLVCPPTTCDAPSQPSFLRKNPNKLLPLPFPPLFSQGCGVFAAQIAGTPPDFNKTTARSPRHVFGRPLTDSAAPSPLVDPPLFCNERPGTAVYICTQEIRVTRPFPRHTAVHRHRRRQIIRFSFSFLFSSPLDPSPVSLLFP